MRNILRISVVLVIGMLLALTVGFFNNRLAIADDNPIVEGVENGAWLYRDLTWGLSNGIGSRGFICPPGVNIETETDYYTGQFKGATISLACEPSQSTYNLETEERNRRLKVATTTVIGSLLRWSTYVHHGPTKLKIGKVRLSMGGENWSTTAEKCIECFKLDQAYSQKPTGKKGKQAKGPKPIPMEQCAAQIWL